MSFRQNLQILIMDGSNWWVPVMKRGLEFLAPEYRVRLAENEVEAINRCIKEKISVIILDPEDFQSVYLIQTLRKIQEERLIILLVSPEAVHEQRERHGSAGDILILVRPCSFKTIHTTIQGWVYGKKLSVSEKIGSALLRYWGFSETYIGFRYLCDALAEYAMEPRQPMKSIYSSIEAYRQNSARNIQGAIRTVVKNAWKTGRMNPYFNHLPSTKELLAALYKELDKTV